LFFGKVNISLIQKTPPLIFSCTQHIKSCTRAASARFGFGRYFFKSVMFMPFEIKTSSSMKKLSVVSEA